MDFDSIPTRIFLDSSTLQTIQDYGGIVFEGEEIPQTDRIHRMTGFPDELLALHWIFALVVRAPFEFALSENSLAEVVAQGDPRYLQWAYDVLDHWHACLEGYGESPFSGEGDSRARALDDASAFGYLSAKDRLLIRDAVQLECDAFLTMEKRLPRNAPHLEKQLGLRVVRPTTLWALLRPWAALFR